MIFSIISLKPTECSNWTNFILQKRSLQFKAKLDFNEAALSDKEVFRIE